MWDTHIRLGGCASQTSPDSHPVFDPQALDPLFIAAGTNLQTNVTGPDLLTNAAAFLAMHITPHASGYFEVRECFCTYSHLSTYPCISNISCSGSQGTWIWLADHNLDGKTDQVSLYSGRGLLSESKGPVWLVGTASEHHVLYQYYLHHAENHYIGLMQTESVRLPQLTFLHPVTEVFARSLTGNLNHHSHFPFPSTPHSQTRTSQVNNHHGV